MFNVSLLLVSLQRIPYLWFSPFTFIQKYWVYYTFYYHFFMNEGKDKLFYFTEKHTS